VRALAARVTYLGHSSSLVSICPCDEPPAPRLEPSPDGYWGSLRVARPGLLEAIERQFDAYAAALVQSKGAAPRLPMLSAWARYKEVRPAGPEVAHGEFQELHVFALPLGCRLPLSATLRVTEIIRDAAMSLAAQPVVEELSGHRPDGSQSRKDHAAFVPLPHIGSGYADGHLLGIGMALPRLDPDTRRAVLTPVGRVRRLALGRAGAWDLRSSLSSDVRGLQHATWTRPSRRWASVTPIVLHRYPKHGSMEAIIAQSCTHAGLPRPSEIIPTPATQFEGGSDARAFRGLNARPHTHAILCFDRPVRGPLILGAGRYQGYGLLRPLETT
jgi:CRISPR-associated protein Csb2